MEHLKETQVSREVVFTGKVLTIQHDQVRLPNGNVASREVVRHPGAIAVVPVLPDGRIVMVRQYRYPVEEVLLEIPAGKLDPGESPEACAYRELQEETGYQAGRLEPLGYIYTAPGFTNERIYLYRASDLTFVAAMPDHDEFLEVAAFPLEEVLGHIETGVIADAKTIVGVLREARQRC